MIMFPDSPSGSPPAASNADHVDRCQQHVKGAKLGFDPLTNPQDRAPWLHRPRRGRSKAPPQRFRNLGPGRGKLAANS